MAGSLKYGQATASLAVGKWSAASRQNTLAAALKEWGTLRRTIHAAVDVEAELAKLDPAGWRPLRPAAPDLSLLL
jgi:TnpA family transposase